MKAKIILAEAPSAARSQGEMLFRTGGVESFAWRNAETVFNVYVQDRDEKFMVRITPLEKERGVSFSCTCFPGGKLCRHAVAAVLGIEAVVDKRYPPNSLFVGRSGWEKLRAQFEGKAVPAAGTGEKPLDYVLVDLDHREAYRRLTYRRKGVETHGFGQIPPSELRGFVLSWLPMEDREAAFATWLASPMPSPYGVQVLWKGEMREVPKLPPVALEAETELDLRNGRPVVRRKIRTVSESESAEVVACIAEQIFYLKSGRFGFLEEERGGAAWQGAKSVFGEMDGGGGEELADLAAGEIEVEPAQWNDANLAWGSGDAPAVLTDGEPLREIPRGNVEAVLRAGEWNDTIELSPEFRCNGVELSHAKFIAGVVKYALDGMPRTFLNSAERRSIFARAAFGLMAAKTKKERAAIIAGVRKEPVVSRIKHGARNASRGLQSIVSLAEEAPELTLHCGTVGENESWFLVADGFKTAAAMVGIAMNAVPSAEPGDDGLLRVSPKDFHARLPELFAACDRAGIGFLWNDEAVEPIKLDFLVRADRDETDLDWFALSPEVLADGSSIPQEKWDALMSGTLLRAEGKLRVVDVESAATLSKLRDVLRLQTEENQPGKKRRNEPLRVPRLRMFDWLALRKAGVRCELPPEEAEILEALASFDGLPNFPVPKKLRATMRPYQKEGYEWLAFLYRNRFGACLADDMGLGKTLQTIALLAGIREGIVGRPGEKSGKRKKDRRAHLVVLPPTLLFNWRHEIETFYPDLQVEEYTGAERDLEKIESDVILTTYELARRDIEILEKRDFDVIVFDEAQAIKNLAGERSKAMRRLKGRFKICLTGTPLENHAGEYYSILELALPGLFGDYRRFMKSLDGEGFQPIDRARPFVLRRTKEKILRELPAKVESDVWLDLTQTQKAFYSRAVAEVREEVFRAFKDKTAQQAGIVALAALTRLRQICISPTLIDPEHTEVSPKIDYMMGKTVELGEEGHAALIFSQFTKTLDLMERHLTKGKIEFLRMDGTTPQAKRKEYVAAFQKASGPPVFLISLKTGGVGLNLTRASYVFHLDPWWNPAVENQASDRAHRIGQKQRVFVNRLLMRHTVEEKMMLLKERKRALFDQVFSGAENRTGSGLLTRDDMAWLLE